MDPSVLWNFILLQLLVMGIPLGSTVLTNFSFSPWMLENAGFNIINYISPLPQLA